jgi:quinol monooxygenase YgiN
VPAQKNQAAGLLRQLAMATRGDQGGLRFEALQRTGPTHHFMLLEVWKDQAALDAHAAAAHTKEFQNKLKPLLMAPVDDRLCLTTFVAPLPPPQGKGATYVVSHVDVPPNVRDKILDPLRKLAETSRKDNGNQRFDVTHQKNRINHFTVIEVWKDQKASDAHELAAHTKEFRGVLVPMTGALYDQRWYTPL